MTCPKVKRLRLMLHPSLKRVPEIKEKSSTDKLIRNNSQLNTVIIICCNETSAYLLLQSDSLAQHQQDPPSSNEGRKKIKYRQMLAG